MCKQTLKEVVKEMCKAYPGGRSAMAGALGMTETTFNNNLYEKNGCRFFEREELEAMEDLSNTSFLAGYYANRRNLLLVEKISPEDLDEPELFRLHTQVSSKQGELAIFMEKSLEDGKVDSYEEKELHKLLDTLIAKGRTFINAFIKLHKKGWRPRYAVRGVGC
ncbi:YmfL family putative regulatory protein [Providencia rettgeri]|nr:YmfL family putative regulatory protein [Providencia rettgeri]MDK3107254.1 YmfL family putative regulatory protein [Providencia rettgeri]